MSRHTNLTQPPTTKQSSGEDGEFCVWFLESSIRLSLTRCASGLEHLRRAGETRRSASSSTRSAAGVPGSDQDWSTLEERCDAVPAPKASRVDAMAGTGRKRGVGKTSNGRRLQITTSAKRSSSREQGCVVESMSEKKRLHSLTTVCSWRCRAGKDTAAVRAQ
jgi:hypothetical protein